MIKKNLPILIVLLVIACNTKQPISIPDSLVNPAHLDKLYEQIIVSGDTMAIVHIYSDYPDYRWAWENHEGIACVDDAARAAIFYALYYDYSKEETYLRKAKHLTEFLLYMQAENGYFYNFILEDFTINREYQRSKAIPDWWTWRALWALSEVRKIIYFGDRLFAERIRNSMTKTINAIKKDFSAKIEYRDIEGFRVPAWLPADTGSDQGAALLLGLYDYYMEYPDQQLLDIMHAMCEGILQMQAGDSLQFPHNAFLSWRNIWHAWGNIQSYVLLKTYPLLHQNHCYISALREINHFYKYLVDNQYYSDVSLKRSENKIVIIEIKKAPQIAYGIRPMVYSCLEAFKMSGDTSYARMAGKIGGWFFGDNFVAEQMYDPESGICYDGINENGEVNRNSGAESTIEALLSLLFIEKVPPAKKELMDYYMNHLD